MTMETMPVVLFLVFIGMVLGLSFFLARKAKSASDYYAAGGNIHWFVNGIAFAGDYLSAASFLGICGMIATYGYDGFLYSIGYLAGWIVALFVVAEPMKRLGKYTFTDALDSKFNSKGIQFTAALSTLIVSIFYLIPQMVGAGVLITPLLGFPHYVGVILVGVIVITIVATAGMTSTTYVQFLKGGLLILFSSILVWSTFDRGFTTTPDQGGKVPWHKYMTLAAEKQGEIFVPADTAYEFVSSKVESGYTLVTLKKGSEISWWKADQGQAPEKFNLLETQWMVKKADGSTHINGAPESTTNKLRQVGNLESIAGKTGPEAVKPKVGLTEFLATISDPKTKIKLWRSVKFTENEETVTVFVPVITSGNKIMRPGTKFKIEGTFWQKFDFASLMLALFCGTAALPHILIRYYTVPSPAAARKSTIVAIAAIGFFYILTLFMGLGAMTSGTVNLLSDNMSAPLLARSFGTFLFSIISAIAFATVLGTVSGLIIAASGAVAHDLLDRFMGMNLTEEKKVKAGKTAAFVVGLIAIILGILFKGMNVSFLVGWAFSVAASANLPAIIMLLFWKRTNATGIVASITVGIIAAMSLILMSPSMYKLYGLNPATAPVPFDNPGLVSIPLSFLALIVFSLMSKPAENQEAKAA